MFLPKTGRNHHFIQFDLSTVISMVTVKVVFVKVVLGTVQFYSTKPHKVSQNITKEHILKG